MTKLILRRDTGWADKLRTYHIFLDGTKIYKLKEGAEFTYEIEEGHHVVEAKIDWCGSRPFHFDAHSDDVYVSVMSALRGAMLFLGWLYMLFNRRGYLKLELETPQKTQ